MIVLLQNLGQQAFSWSQARKLYSQQLKPPCAVKEQPLPHAAILPPPTDPGCLSPRRAAAPWSRGIPPPASFLEEKTKQKKKKEKELETDWYRSVLTHLPTASVGTWQWAGLLRPALRPSGEETRLRPHLAPPKIFQALITHSAAISLSLGNYGFRTTS